MAKTRKRKENPVFRKWRAFVERVKKEEGISYKQAMVRAKQRSKKGENWKGGSSGGDEPVAEVKEEKVTVEEEKPSETSGEDKTETETVTETETDETLAGGKKRRRRGGASRRHRRGGRKTCKRRRRH